MIVVFITVMNESGLQVLVARLAYALLLMLVARQIASSSCRTSLVVVVFSHTVSFVLPIVTVLSCLFLVGCSGSRA